MRKEVKGIGYELNVDGKSYVVVSVEKCRAKHLIIPAFHEGLPVTAIDWICDIRECLFESIFIPETMNDLRNMQFTMPTLMKITVDENNEYYSSLDGDLYNKEQTQLIQRVVGKKEETFAMRNSVKSMALHSSAYGSFKRVILSDNLEDVDKFTNCKQLTEFIIGEKNENFCVIDGNLYSKDKSILYRYAPGKTETTFVVPKEVKEIEVGAFDSAEYLTCIDLPDGLKRIGNCAFWGCIHLKELVVPDTVESIGYNAWDHCEELATITIGENVTKIGDETICNCESLQTIIFKNPVSWKAAKEEIDSADLADPFKAVEMMRKYVYCEWERKK